MLYFTMQVLNRSNLHEIISEISERSISPLNEVSEYSSQNVIEESDQRILNVNSNIVRAVRLTDRQFFSFVFGKCAIWALPIIIFDRILYSVLKKHVSTDQPLWFTKFLKFCDYAINIAVIIVTYLCLFQPILQRAKSRNVEFVAVPWRIDTPTVSEI